MKKAIIIQARLGSSRMPGKILRPFYGEESILSILLKRLLKSFPDIPVVVATSVDPSNDSIEAEAVRIGASCFRGDENDVLSRFIGAAQSVSAEAIIRVCSDNPFLSTDAISQEFNALESPLAPDYTGFWVNDRPNILTHHGFYPEGVTLDALSRVEAKTQESLYHEHVTNYIYTHPDSFSILWLNPDPVLEGRSDIRLTIDTSDDFAAAARVYDEMVSSGTPLSVASVVNHIDSADPDLIESMKNQIDRNSK